MWDCWKTMFLRVADKHAPIKKKRVRNKRSPWLTANIKKLMIERDKLKLTAIRINTTDDWQNYRIVKNNVNNEIKKAKTQYYQENFRVHSGKPRETWQTINEILSRNIRHDCKINSIKTDSGDTTSPEVMSETFNQYFTEIGPNLAEKLPNSSKTHSDFIGHVDSSFQLEPVTLPKVLKLLKKYFR